MSGDTKIPRIDNLLREWADYMQRNGVRSSTSYPAYNQRGVRVDCNSGGFEPPDLAHLWNVDKAIAALKQTYAEGFDAVKVYYLNNWSAARCGHKLGCTGRTVLARVYRAHRLIADWLEEHGTQIKAGAR